MSRPSLKEQRYQQVMDAYETCVARHGLEGATLERIADQACLARPLIRHNVGNRRDLLQGLMRRFEQRCDEFIRYLKDAENNTDSTEQFVTALFQSDCDTARLAYALAASAQEDESIDALLKRWGEMLKQFLVVYLKQHYLDASDEAINAVAVGISAIYSNAQIYRAMNVEGLNERSGRAAIRLVESLARI